MSISIQTNVDSLVAQSNLSTNSAFQSKTIKQLTSGYRINSSADDAAGLAIANSFRSSEAELTQGVQNANDGISTLQIVDGGIQRRCHAVHIRYARKVDGNANLAAGGKARTGELELSEAADGGSVAGVGDDVGQ